MRLMMLVAVLLAPLAALAADPACRRKNKLATQSPDDRFRDAPSVLPSRAIGRFPPISPSPRRWRVSGR